MKQNRAAEKRREKLSAKRNKLNKKEQQKEQLELEKRLIAEGKIAPRVRYERRSFLWNALSVSLAFLFGIIAAFGGLIGGGYLVLTKVSVQKAVSLIGLDSEKFVTDEWADSSVLAIVQDFMQTGFVNLNSIGKYTPFLREQVAKIGDVVDDMGITLDVDEFMDVPLAEIGTYMNDMIMSAELGSVLKLDANSDPLMLSICYGKEGAEYDYTVNEAGEIVMNEGKEALTLQQLTEDSSSIIQNVEVATVMDINADSSSAMRYLAFGTQDFDYTIVVDEETGEKSIQMLGDRKPKTIADLSESDSLLDDAKIGDLMDIVTDEEAEADPSLTPSSKLMQAMKSWKISDLKQQSRIERLKLGQVLTIGEDASSLMKAIADWRIGDMSKQEKINSLVLGDVLAIDESSPVLLQSLKNTAIGNFDQAVTSLQLRDMMEGLEDNQILSHLQYSTVDTLSSDLESLTFQQVFHKEVYGYYDPAHVTPRDDEERVETDKPTNVLSGDEVFEIRTYGGHELSDGYFTEMSGGTLITDADVKYDAVIQMNNRNAQKAYDDAVAGGETPAPPVWNTPYYYVKQNVVLSNYTFGVVDYDNGGAIVPLTSPIFPAENEDGTPMTDGDGNPVYAYEKVVGANEDGTDAIALMYLSEDASGDYAQSADKRYRDDLERVYSYYLSAADMESGNAIPERPQDPSLVQEGVVYLDDLRHFKGDGTTDAYSYYEERVPVYEGHYYVDGETVYHVDEEDIDWSYYRLIDAETGEHDTSVELIRELKDMWYLFLTDDEGNEVEFSLLEMDEIVAHVTNHINNVDLYTLWVHDILQGSMPNVDIEGLNYQVNGVVMKNINYLNIYQTIHLVDILTARTLSVD